jgi:hypothetical protein
MNFYILAHGEAIQILGTFKKIFYITMRKYALELVFILLERSENRNQNK